MRLALIPFLLGVAAVPSVLAAQSSPSPLSVPDAGSSQAFTGSRSEQVLAVQVLLDRSRFSPGVIDGITGENTRRAIRAFERVNGMSETGEISADLLSRLRGDGGEPILQTYVITSDDADGPFVETPADMPGMAKLETLAFESPLELLGEKFHMDTGLLTALNPGADFGTEGTNIVVVAPGDEKLGAKVDRIEVDKAAESVRAYDADGKLVARYPATIGSSTFPSPNGSMTINAVAHTPKYYFSPEGRDWGPDEKLTIAAGPNNPIGGTWIDLSKEGYGIHGTPDPSLIGKSSSHGCVRLTNWDVEELGQAVSAGVKVEFV